MSSTVPSAGFVHGMLQRAAKAVERVNLRIRALLTLPHVVCCEETPIRVGPRKPNKYLLVACNSLFTWYMLGDRTLATFKRFVVAEATGVIVHDRYQNYDSAELGEHEHQLCCSHLLRDLEDCAETYPDAIEIQTALRGLIHAPLDATRPDPGLKPRLGRIRSHPTPITHRDQDTPDCIKAECLRPLLKCGSATETQ